MARSIKKFSVAFLFLYQISGIAGFSETLVTEPPRTITVRLYNYAKVPASILDAAALKARRVYDKTGIETIWMECRTSMSESVKNPACQQYPGPAVAQLKILPRWMAERAPVEGNVFGFALPARKGEFSNFASVFFHRVEQLSRDTDTSSAVILGHMLAHELGHLLLGLGSHSSRGIMRIPWREKQLKLAEMGGFTFSAKQAKAMRADVRRRNIAAPGELARVEAFR